MMHGQLSGSHVSFGDLLRRYREAAGLSQEALAERAALSPRGLLYLERGMHRPYPGTLRRLADALSLTPQEREALMLAGPPRPTSPPATPPGGANPPPAGEPAAHPLAPLPMAASELPLVDAPAPLPAGEAQAPFVGRTPELALLERHLAGA